MKISIIAVLFLPILAFAETLTIPTQFNSAKNSLDDEVYFDHRLTLYCGCEYESHGDSDGSGDVDPAACDIPVQSLFTSAADRIEWEHIVPASHMPARMFSCWADSTQILACSESGRGCCEDVSLSARLMIYDLHNLAPSVGQINQYRKNGRYGEISNPDDTWGSCPIKDMGGLANGPEHLFEPADCTKGDVARVWLYMHQTHGVLISDDELIMFHEWNDLDPVSEWEKTKHDRILEIQGTANPFVHEVVPHDDGACEWEE